MMRARLHEGVGLVEFAAASGLARSGFCAAYHRHRGRSPGRFLAECRLQLADLLIASGSPIGDVAERCGFADATSFGRMYRRCRGHAASCRTLLGLTE